MLFIGSQCGGLPNLPLPFLPSAAKDLFDVLVDPDRGGCQPDASRLVLDPDLTTMVAEVKAAVSAADEAQATLLLAFVGHAEAVGNDLYLLPMDGESPPSMDTGFLFGQRLAELVRRHSGLDGLILLVDACQSGIGVADMAVRAGADIAEAGMRVQLVTSTFDQASRDGCFTHTLHRLLRDGIPGLSQDYLLAESILGVIAGSCTGQEEPRAATIQGRWRVNDPGLFLSRNPAAGRTWLLASTAAGGQAVDLTRDFQPTATMQSVVAAWRSHPVVALSGGPGTGKSAIVAALTRPEVAPDTVPPGFMHAVAFAATSPDAVAIAVDLAGQLNRLPGFSAAAQRFATRFEQRDLDQLDALTRLVAGPLSELTVTGSERERIAIDGLDQLDAATRTALTSAVDALTGDTRLTGARVLLTGRPQSLPDLGPTQTTIRMDEVSEEDTHAYLRARSLPEGLISAIPGHVRTWLDARLLGDLAHSLDVDDVGWPSTARVTVDDLYARAISAAQRRVDDQMLVSAGLGVLAAAGTGPTLPVRLMRDALRELGWPLRESQTRDLLVQFGGLAIRAKPGSSGEMAGLVHETLLDHLARNNDSETNQLRRGHEAILAVLDRDGEVEGSGTYLPYARTARAEHLWAVGRWPEALTQVTGSLGRLPADNLGMLRPWLQRCVQQLGRDHPTTLVARDYLAWWTGSAGDAAGARDAFAELLADRERLLGPEHPDTLSTRAGLAAWTGWAGNAAGARDAFAELLADRQRVLGPDHEDTLSTRADLAAWTGWAGNAAGARDAYAELLADRTRVLGPDHEDTLSTRDDLSWWTGRAGDESRAREAYAELLADRERVLGPEHEDTLSTRGDLAAWTGSAGDAAGAREAYAELLADRERVLGPEHEDTLSTRDRLAWWTGSAGDAAGAREAYAELLADRTRVLGPEHEDTLSTRDRLAWWTGSAGDAAGAREAYAELLADRTRVLGPDHPDTLSTRDDLGWWSGRARDNP
ncbi:hypothetical protein N865_19730 [Intrasporangium oryzae NRRL B-24470]|uniref:Uncharacterized protein n=1 Tax=Intrasporangium oryzae NRRL B-24470 TaxID=1386089 RepID=W9G1U4_9MICO|nr:tetratricopeptide repeat protein [Intrasporangium oryzae]EWS99934.1 hypothetical protein N865_19730 [Intrasporangium oryzae NRRL B-24470]